MNIIRAAYKQPLLLLLLLRAKYNKKLIQFTYSMYLCKYLKLVQNVDNDNSNDVNDDSGDDIDGVVVMGENTQFKPF